MSAPGKASNAATDAAALAAAGPPGEAARLRWLGLGAAALALLTRLPFAARRLWDHDSVQFALGVEKYDLAAHHPHPPGYPLYIGILKALAALGIDSLHGMVALSILAAALGAGLIVPLTARLVREAHAWRPRRDARAVHGEALAAAGLAAVLFIFNPLLWFYDELPLVYAVEGGMTVALAWAALRMGDGRAAFLAGCALFAVAGGIRPSTLVLLAPLFLFGLWRAWRRGATLPTLASGLALGVACGLTWLLPLLAAAGGYAAYQSISRQHFSALLPYTSILYGAGWGALAHNLTLILKWFLQGLLPAALALASLAAATALARRSPLRALAAGLRHLRANGLFLAAWAVPPILFFALFHITKAGYTLVYLPALLVAAGLLAAPALAAARDQGASADDAAEMPTAGSPELATAHSAAVFAAGSSPEPAAASADLPAAGSSTEPAAVSADFPASGFSAVSTADSTVVLAAGSVPSLLAAPTLASARRSATADSAEPTADSAAMSRAAAARAAASAAAADHRFAGPDRHGRQDSAAATAWPASCATSAPRARAVPAPVSLLVLTLGLAAAAGAVLFLFGADRRPDQPRAFAIVRHEFNRSSIATYERDLDHLLAILRRLPPATTVLATVELSGTGSAGPDAFLYPWQRHLQWYLPDYEVLHLVPEERFALVTTGHRPFHKEGPTLQLPPSTRNLAIVVSGPTGSRFPLPPLQAIGSTFSLVLVPVSPHLRLGPFLLETAPAQRSAA